MAGLALQQPAEFEDARGFGWNAERPAFDWPRLRDNKTHEIERLNGIYENLLTGAGVHIKRGRAELVDAEQIRMDDKVYTARNIPVFGWQLRYSKYCSSAAATVTS